MLGLAILLYWRKRTSRKLHPQAINPPGHWDFFLSHTQQDPLAVALAEILYSELTKMGKTVWLDVRMTKRA